MSSVMSLLNEIGDGPPHFLQRCRITFMPPTFTHGSERESTESYLLWFGDNWDSVEQIEMSKQQGRRKGKRNTKRPPVE
jgi:hypothetical protein